MIDLSFLRHAPVAVLGLGKSGLAAARALKAANCEVWAWDDQPAGRAALQDMGIEPVDLMAQPLEGIETLILSPGIPHHLPKPHPVVERAAEAGVAVVSDIDIFARAHPTARVIAITGTNGKSTTTALIGHIIREAGIEVAVGGNIGEPVLTLPTILQGFYVLELSSYQLDLTWALRPEVAVLLNLTPDHIDRHGDMAGYAAAKRRIFRKDESGRCLAVVGVDDAPSRAIYDELREDPAWEAAVAPITIGQKRAGAIAVENGVLHDGFFGVDYAVMDLSDLPRLRGAHNWQNIAAAYAACWGVGLGKDGPKKITDGIRSFAGLAHRQQLITTAAGVAFVNDSKATNAEATAKALVCYDPIHWIVGGKPKEGGLDGLEPFMGRIAHAYVIGAAEDDFAAWLGRNGVPFTRCGTLDKASAAAWAAARAADAPSTVLLSPACASFDQFRSFEHRGEVFADLVARLTMGVPA